MVTLQNNYNSHSFAGKKTVVLSTAGWLGGRNAFLGRAYIVVGMACFLLALLLTLLCVVFPMSVTAHILSSLLGGGGDEVHPHIPHQVLQGHLSAPGFRWDRQWAVVNAKGRTCTQRVEPKMALVEVEMPPEAFAEDWQPSSDSYLVIRAPGMDALKVPLAAEHATLDDEKTLCGSGLILLMMKELKQPNGFPPILRSQVGS